MRKVEIETFVRGGLPVVAIGWFRKGKPMLQTPAAIFPPEPDMAEDVTLFFKNGKSPYTGEVSEADMDRIVSEICEAGRAEEHG